MSSCESEVEIVDEETAITEITFLPDGRCCLFGASREVLELLNDLNLGDPLLAQRLTAIQGCPRPADTDQSK